MKEHALTLITKQMGTNEKLNILREYLQASILQILHAQGFFEYTAFVGGTALRFLYQLPRYSEDLDFSLIAEEKTTFELLLKRLKSELVLSGYNVSLTYKENNIQSAHIKFSQLMFEANISPHKNQILSIKLDIDTRPPKGGKSETKIVNKYFPLMLRGYDRPSLFAGKIHALLARSYTKGRDYFDLGWYLSRWKDLTPNFFLLKNALRQTGWEREMPNEATWKNLLIEQVKKNSWEKIEDDVLPFLEKPSDKNVFSQKNILSILKSES